MSRFQDLTGNKYNRLTAVKYMGNHKWTFKCDCGREIVAYSDNVKRGLTKSCGCLKHLTREDKYYEYEDIRGQKFNKLTATRYIGDGKWECACDCGGVTIASKSNLKNGTRKSCGCLKRIKGSESRNWKGDQVCYTSFHKRVREERGMAGEYGCSVCGRKDDGVSYDWANLTGHYEDTNDYAPMCRSCHRKYDYGRKKVEAHE